MTRILLIVTLLTSTLMAQPSSTFGNEFLPIWQRACAYTLEVADAMPEDLYRYCPDTTVMNVGEHLVHISENLYSLTSRFITETGFPSDRYTRRPADSLSKAEIRTILEDACAFVAEPLSAMTDEEMGSIVPSFWGPDPASRRVIFMLMRDHMTHHRAALVVYLRNNGIEPPRFRGW